jgi:hypothetical protein
MIAGAVTSYLVVYLAGVALGLAVMRDPWPARLGTALVWPLGPIAFLVVLAILLVAATLLWPLLMIAAGAIIAAGVWLIA